MPQRRHLAILFAAALAARAAIFAGAQIEPARPQEPDSGRYLILADNLRTYQTFGKAEEDGFVHKAIARLRASNSTLPPPDRQGFRPESFRTPGYPLFIATVNRCGGGIKSVLLLQDLFGSLLAPAVAAIVAALGAAPFAALAAGGLWALHPALATFDNMLMTESLFDVCVVIAWFVIIRWPTPSMAVLSGALIGSAALVRPLGLLYLPGALIFLTSRSNVRRALSAGLLIVTASLPSVLWAARNAEVGEGFRVSSVADHNLLFYTVAYTLAEQHGHDWGEEWEANVLSLASRVGARLQSGEDVFLAARHLALEELRQRPVAAARVLLKSSIKLMVSHSVDVVMHQFGRPYQPTGLFARIGLGEDSAAHSGSTTALLFAMGWTAGNAVLALTALAGLVLAIRRNRWAVAMACVVTVATFVGATGGVGLERFRLPIILPLIILASECAWRPDAHVHEPDSARARQGLWR